MARENAGASSRDAQDEKLRSDREHCQNFAGDLYRLAVEQANLRQPIERRWYQDNRQYFGRYDEDTEAKLLQRKNSSKVFVNLTRPKTRTLRARMADIMFPTDEANWDIHHTPVPEIEDLAAAADAAPPPPWPVSYTHLTLPTILRV